MRCAVSTQCIRARRRPLRLVAQSSDGHYKAYAEFKLTHYAKAREVWETLAEVGNGDALFNLGVATWRQRRDSYAAQLTVATQSLRRYNILTCSVPVVSMLKLQRCMQHLLNKIMPMPKHVWHECMKLADVFHKIYQRRHAVLKLQPKQATLKRSTL